MFAGRGSFALPWRTRRRMRRDDTGSMPLALLVTLVSVTLSAGLSGVVVGQLRDTKREADRVAAINAAQAGLDAGLAKIRSAFDATGGLLDRLPCSTLPLGSLTAGTGTASTTPTYSTSVAYFLVNPSSFIEALRPIGDLTNVNGLVSTNATTPLTDLVGNTLTLANGVVTTVTDALSQTLNSAVGCVNGVLTQVPLYGLLRSVGTVGNTTRTLYATYKFRNLDETIPGGLIVIAGQDGSYSSLCLGWENPTTNDKRTVKAGDAVNAVSCSADKNNTTFIYPKNLSLSLAYSRTNASTDGSSPYPYGVCITSPVTLFDQAPVTYEPCSATSDITQQWDYDVNQNTYWAGTIKNGVKARSSFCLNMKTPSALGGVMVLSTGSTNCGKPSNFGRSFKPDKQVGAGGAGLESEQYVNKDEVGRCLDLTNEDPSGNWAKNQKTPLALISYPCKQSINGLPWWNHVWVGPLTPTMIKNNVTEATGPVYTVQPTTPPKQWCMTSPGAAGGWVWVSLCSAGEPTQQWTVYGATELIKDAYRVVDVYGNCLEAAAWRGPSHQYKTWSYIITAPCDGSADQKWNAPTDPDLAPLKSIQEK